MKYLWTVLDVDADWALGTDTGNLNVMTNSVTSPSQFTRVNSLYLLIVWKLYMNRTSLKYIMLITEVHHQK